MASVFLPPDRRQLVLKIHERLAIGTDDSYFIEHRIHTVDDTLHDQTRGLRARISLLARCDGRKCDFAQRHPPRQIHDPPGTVR